MRDYQFLQIYAPATQDSIIPTSRWSEDRDHRKIVNKPPRALVPIRNNSLDGIAREAEAEVRGTIDGSGFRSRPFAESQEPYRRAASV